MIFEVYNARLTDWNVQWTSIACGISCNDYTKLNVDYLSIYLSNDVLIISDYFIMSEIYDRTGFEYLYDLKLLGRQNCILGYYS